MLQYLHEVLRDQEVEEEPAKDTGKEQSVKRKNSNIVALEAVLNPYKAYGNGKYLFCM